MCNWERHLNSLWGAYGSSPSLSFYLAVTQQQQYSEVYPEVQPKQEVEQENGVV
jgi:hypothetical protein